VVNLIAPAIIFFLLASFLKVSFIYNVAYLLFGVQLLVTFWTRQSIRDLRIRRQFPERALLGDDVEVTIEVENQGWLPVPWLLILDRLPVALAVPPFFRELISLRSRERRRFTYRVHCRTRGWYEIGPLTASLGDVLGLTFRRDEYASARHLTVYPKILPLDELGFPSKSPFGNLRTRQPLYEDPSRVVGIRDYQIGDSLRLINWKASATAGGLQVRRLEPAMTLQTVIFLDVLLGDFDRSSAYSAAELGIVVAASLANHLVDLRQEVGLLTNGLDPAAFLQAEDSGRMTGYLPGKGRGHLTGILELLGRLRLAHEVEFWPLVQAEVRRLPWGATLAFVAPSESSVLLDTVVMLKRSGFSIVLVYVDYPDPVSFEVAERRASTMGVRAYRVWRETDVDVWRRGVERPEAAGARRSS
jgi:uncharacterized protein (DUF58 family)